VVIRVKGSHHVLRDTTGKMVVVPVHKGETLGIGLVRKILHEAGISLTDYQSYFLG
jgi:predicted RNA binding protein YcfA (HicA-like mRNA interferase family)